VEKGEGGQRRVYHGAEPAAGIHRRPPPAAQAPAHLPSRLSHLPVSNLPSVWAFFDAMVFSAGHLAVAPLPGPARLCPDDNLVS